MASSSRAERTYHQDYIARIRYTNTLPPPPNPPKLLKIPGTGLAGGDFSTATYASRLARDQALNIEADAELGLPIDLVGVPGVFTGDESSIQGLQDPPQPHPHDRPLLRPVTALGKSNTLASNVSFLRRTEYISSDAGRAGLKSSTKDGAFLKVESRKRKRDAVNVNSHPSHLLDIVSASFGLANHHSEGSGSNIKARNSHTWEKPVHPSKPELSIVDEYPLLPDPSATTDTGNYILVKFQTNPVASTQSYDERLDVGILRPLAISAEAEALYETQVATYQRDPTQPEPTRPHYEFELFLPQNTTAARHVKSKADVSNPARDDDTLYDSAAEGNDRRFFSYSRVRAYETYQKVEDQEDPFGDTLAIALHDPDMPGTEHSNLQKAAYFYPVSQRSYIRPRRGEQIAKTGLGRGSAAYEADKVDLLEVVIRDEDPNERETRAGWRSQHFENVLSAAV